MGSITDQPFPVARDEDGMRVARAFAESKNPPPSTAGYRLLEAYKKRCEPYLKNHRKDELLAMAIEPIL